MCVHTWQDWQVHGVCTHTAFDGAAIGQPRTRLPRVGVRKQTGVAVMPASPRHCEPHRASQTHAAHYTRQHYITKHKINLPNKQYCAPLPGKKAKFSQIWRGSRAYHASIAGRKSAMHPPLCVYTHGVYGVRAIDAVRRERACRASACGKQTASR